MDRQLSAAPTNGASYATRPINRALIDTQQHSNGQAPRRPTLTARAQDPLDEPYAAWVQREAADSSDAVKAQSLLRSIDGNTTISFAGGQPAAELLPRAALARAFARAMLADGTESLYYGPSQGAWSVRERVCDRLKQRGIQAVPDQVLMTSGSTQGLDLLGRTLLISKILAPAPLELCRLDASADR